jgi:hypothetical protein
MTYWLRWKKTHFQGVQQLSERSVYKSNSSLYSSMQCNLIKTVKKWLFNKEIYHKEQNATIIF